MLWYIYVVLDYITVCFKYFIYFIYARDCINNGHSICDFNHCFVDCCFEVFLEDTALSDTARLSLLS